MKNILAFVVGLLAGGLLVVDNAEAALVVNVCGDATHACRSDPLGSTSGSYWNTNDKIDKVKVTDESGDSRNIHLSMIYPDMTPPGFTPGMPGNQAPVPPSSTSSTSGFTPSDVNQPKAFQCSDNAPISYTWTCAGTPVTLQYCKDYLAWIQEGGGNAHHGCKVADANQAWTGGFYYSTGNSAPTPYPGATTFAPFASCPAGYVLSGSTCDLDNSNAVQQPTDGHCDFHIEAGVWATNPNDPDCSPSALASKNTSGRDTNKIKIQTGSETVQFTRNADGSVTAEYITPDGGGNSRSMGATITPATGSTNSGTVTGTGTGTLSGTGTNVSTSGGDTNGDGEASCGAPGQPMCNTKIDEAGTSASTSTGDAATADLNARISSLNSTGDLSGYGIGSFEAPSGADGFAPSLGIAGSDTCSDPSVTLFGNATNLPMCQIAQYAKPILSWMMYALTALYLWSLWARNEGAA